MLTLTGTIRAVTTLGGGVNKKTGEVIPTRPVLRSRASDNRGLVQLFTLTVPDTKPLRACWRTGDRACACLGSWRTVSLAYEGARCERMQRSRAAACGPGGCRSPHPGTLAAALEFIHTNNCPTQYSMLSGRFEARVYASETG
jgi:hypothetical protein